jgi:hypothetical protein
MAKVTYQKIEDINVCLSNGGIRQFFCPNCGSGNVKHYEIDSEYFKHCYYKTEKNRLHCNSCGEHCGWSERLSDRVEGEPKTAMNMSGRAFNHLTHERNHEPHEQGIWFDYTGFRFKDYYDIELFDGTIVKSCRPNGNGWYGNGERDVQVKRVRLKPDNELDPKWHFTGQERIQHNLEMFGEKA